MEPSFSVSMSYGEYAHLVTKSIVIGGEISVNESYVTNLIDTLRESGADHVKVYVSSPGGNVAGGLSIIRAIREAQQAGTRFTGVVRGEAASMGFFILQACDVRKMGPGDVLMAHGITAGMFGDAKNLDALQKLITVTRQYLTELIVNRAEVEEEEKIQWWGEILKDATPVYFTPEEALAEGLVDEIEVG